MFDVYPFMPWKKHWSATTIKPMKILETERLVLRLLAGDDAEFYLRLVNKPLWLQFIRDKGDQNRRGGARRHA